MNTGEKHAAISTSESWKLPPEPQPRLRITNNFDDFARAAIIGAMAPASDPRLKSLVIDSISEGGKIDHESYVAFKEATKDEYGLDDDQAAELFAKIMFRMRRRE